MYVGWGWGKGVKRSIKFNKRGSEMKFSEMSVEMKKNILSGKSIVCSKSGGGGKKDELLGWFKCGGWNTRELSVKMGLGRKNVSTLVNYLKNDGYLFDEILEGKEKRFVLVGVIRDGVKLEGENRISIGDKGYVVKFNIDEEKFIDEILEDVEVKDEVKKKK